jgi:hypothetical protein
VSDITEHELLQFRGLRSRVFHRARELFPRFHPGALDRGAEMTGFDYIPSVAGLPATLYIFTGDEERGCSVWAFPADPFLGDLIPA